MSVFLGRFRPLYLLSIIAGRGLLLALIALMLFTQVLNRATLTLPDLRGPYAVGRVAVDWVDETRPDPFSQNPAVKRELVVWLWYPAAPAAGAAPAAYLPGKWAHMIEQRNNPLLYQCRANAEISMAKPKKAVGDLNKALSLNPNDPNSYNLRARAYDALADFDKEKDDLDALIKRTAENGVNLLWRARINNQLKNTKEVIADCDHAINLGLGREELADLYKLRADAYKKLGKKKEAKQELAKFNSLQQ